MKKTKIVATIGPACEKPSVLKRLIKTGVDVARINASHTTPSSLRRLIRFVRRTGMSCKKDIAILVDLQGPRIRTGRLEKGMPLNLTKGSRIRILTGPGPGFGETVTTPCRAFPTMVKRGDRVLLDNGLIGMRVLKVEAGRVNCRVLAGGFLGENKGINLPDTDVKLPALSEKDRADLRVAMEEAADYAALSFVRKAEDVALVKKWMRSYGREMPVVAKIEKPQALEHLEKIMEVADGIMVARGDLGIEIGMKKVPVVQQKLIEAANHAGLPVIVATQMLESMMTQPTPTRAETSDVANAVFDGCDAVMLSGETAVGQYPLKAVKIMSDVIREAENYQGRRPDRFFLDHIVSSPLPIHAVAHAARDAAEKLHAKAILVFTQSGKTAMILSQMHPAPPILALTSLAKTVRRLALFRGVRALRIRHCGTVDAMIRIADRKILQERILRRGAPVVIVSGVHAFPSARYMTKIHWIGDR